MNHLPWMGRGTLAATAFAVVAAGALYLVARPDGYAADKDASAPKASTLDFLPADTVAVSTVRVSALWKHPAVKAIRDKINEDMPDAAKAVRGRLGVGLEEIDRLTAFLPNTPSKEPLVAVTTVKPYDKKAVLAAAAPDAVEVERKGPSYYTSKRGTSLVFLDDHTFLISNLYAVNAFLERAEGQKDGPLVSALKPAAEKHLAVAGVDVAAITRTAPLADRLPPDFKPLKPLLQAKIATLTVDLGDELRAAARATFATEADAKDGAAAVDDALDMARGAFVQAMKELNLQDAPKITALLKDVQAALRAAKAEQKGKTVEVEASLKIDPETTTAALAEGVEKVRKAAKRFEMSNDLKQLALSVHSYNDAYGRLPAAAIFDKNGKPLLSWHVMVLPFIDQGNLYNQFHLDEPWDSDHNKKLLEKMPTEFAPPDSQAFKDHEAVFQAIVGKGTAFEKPGLRFPADFPDGTSFIILFVEAKKGVPWTKPEDVSLGDGKLLPKLGGLTENGFMAVLCDGSVRFFPATMKEDALRIWATRNNGQVRPDPEK